MDLLTDYDYDLPDELIARRPPAHREDARLLVVERKSGTLTHTTIRSLPEWLKAGDALILNDTRVVRARLVGTRTQTGGKWEGLYLGPDVAQPDCWKILCQTRGKLQPGEFIDITPPGNAPTAAETLRLRLISRDEEGTWSAQPSSTRPAAELLETHGLVPLPPYMHREQPDAEDIERYQTVYARSPGSVAAPTAGLHFTPDLLSACEARGVNRGFVTLHVGVGTFRPMTATRLDDHHMHDEWCELPADTATLWGTTRTNGGRVVAAGTTSVRTLESAAQNGALSAAQPQASRPWSGHTNLFIRPPYAFQAVDVLLTNFHLPRSTLLVLVSTFAGQTLIRAAYQEAIARGYRFFSYGDAMLIV